MTSFDSLYILIKLEEHIKLYSLSVHLKQETQHVKYSQKVQKGFLKVIKVFINTTFSHTLYHLYKTQDLHEMI